MQAARSDAQPPNEGDYALHIPLHISRFAFYVLPFALPLLTYLLTLAPGLTWAHNGADGGDLISASFTGGIAHPPGYPLYLLLGRLAALLPLGSVPYRYNLLSALAASGAAALVAQISNTQPPKEGDYPTSNWGAAVSGIGAGLSLAFAPLVWGQAVITEVYALNALFSAALVALSIGIPRHPRHAFALSAVFTLAVLHHLTLACFLPLVVLRLAQAGRAVIPTQPSPACGGGVGRGRLVAAALLGVVAGLAPLIYLPLAATGPVVWGDPTTPAGLWWLASGAAYRGYTFGLPMDQVMPRIAVVARTLVESFTLLGVAAGVIGAQALSKRDAPLMWAMLIAALASATFAAGYLTADSQVYLIPLLVCFAAWVGAGWGQVLTVNARLALIGSHPRSFSLAGRREFAPSPPRGEGRDEGQSHAVRNLVGVIAHYALPLLALCAPVWVLARNWQAMDLHADHAARDFADGVIAQAPKRALVITAEDRHTFALWESLFVEHQRMDIIAVDQDMLKFDWYRAALRRDFPGLSVPESSDVNDLIEQNVDRPVCRPTGQPPPWLVCSGN